VRLFVFNQRKRVIEEKYSSGINENFDDGSWISQEERDFVGEVFINF
jgi:hypothetical protein